jgi:hypothetical protein
VTTEPWQLVEGIRYKSTQSRVLISERVISDRVISNKWWSDRVRPDKMA